MKLNLNRYARAALSAGLLASAALLAGCGGGGQAETFAAKRMLAFGDEFSVVNTDGSKYSVSGLATGTTTLDCTVNPIWVQVLASAYGLVFQECPGTSTVTPTSRIYAANQAKVADVVTQIDSYIANGGFVAGDMATVLVGANDLLAEYPTVNEDQSAARLTERGTVLAEQVNRLAALGVKVLIVTAPDMGITPFAGSRVAGANNPTPALLTRLSTKFNDALLANLLNDGRKIGLVQLDEYLKAVDTAAVNKVSGAAYGNSTGIACAVALPGCTSNTLVADALTSVYLWADDRHFGVTAHAALGSLASTRAHNNPF